LSWKSGGSGIIIIIIIIICHYTIDDGSNSCDWGNNNDKSSWTRWIKIIYHLKKYIHIFCFILTKETYI
jgi:hypothetical protein